MICYVTLELTDLIFKIWGKWSVVNAAPDVHALTFRRWSTSPSGHSPRPTSPSTASTIRSSTRFSSATSQSGKLERLSVFFWKGRLHEYTYFESNTSFLVQFNINHLVSPHICKVDHFSTFKKRPLCVTTSFKGNIISLRFKFWVLSSKFKFCLS